MHAQLDLALLIYYTQYSIYSILNYSTVVHSLSPAFLGLIPSPSSTFLSLSLSVSVNLFTSVSDSN